MNWIYTGFILIIVVIAIYTIIPDLLLHYMGIGTHKRQYSSGVAITFDDGPNPEITPQILDILARYNIPATFFVVGENAACHPELIRLILNRGHQIGLHSQHHRYAWFISPWRTWREWEEGLAILERITGKNISYVRPPWGTFNLVTWIWIKVRKKTAVLWNAEGHDWQVRRTPKQITERILKKTKAGSIILLHDAGGEDGAPLNTLRALEILCCKIINEKKLPLIKLDFPE
ncbi:MAG: polysaccharide deacetylase family protein [Syntrophomonas sp.]